MIINSRIMITGGTSMIGRAVIAQLDKSNIIDRCPHSEVDFIDTDDVADRVSNFYPDYIIALAGYNGGIKFNAEKPADIYLQNASIALNTLYWAHKCKVKKVLYIMPSCSYPSKDYLVEDKYWDGACHPTVECHGLARSHFFEYSRQLYKQHDFISVGVCANTVYGPFDHFNENAKVMGSLIKKFVEAKRQNLPEVNIWGTGKPQRGFIYCDDAAKGILHCLEYYNDPMELINLPCLEISILELAYRIKTLSEYDGEIIFDESKPDGQMKKMLSSEKYHSLFNHSTYLDVSLWDGITRTIKWYKENYQ